MGVIERHEKIHCRGGGTLKEKTKRKENIR